MRDYEEIEEFVLELLKEEVECEEGTERLYEKIINKEKLNQSDKELLIDILGVSAKEKMKEMTKLGTNHHTLLSEIDVLSIYSDSWGQYCIGK